MKGIGPSPRPKKPTNVSTIIADRMLIPLPIPIARRSELSPMPETDAIKHVLRPKRSMSGEKAMVTTKFMTATRTLRRDAEVVRMELSKETPYTMMLLIPQSCCAAIRNMTAKVARL